jgi:hypothetical protein
MATARPAAFSQVSGFRSSQIAQVFAHCDDFRAWRDAGSIVQSRNNYTRYRPDGGQSGAERDQATLRQVWHISRSKRSNSGGVPDDTYTTDGGKPGDDNPEVQASARSGAADRAPDVSRTRQYRTQAAVTGGVAFAEVGGPARERDRSVIFYDTADFNLYRNNFMLRKRVSWARDGAAREELVFKFRHPDRHLAAAVDPRPAVEVPHTIRFKEQILPTPDGRRMRSIFWHGCKIRQPAELENVSFSTLARVFPALRNPGADPEERLTAVNGLTVDERLVELGTLKFAKSATAKALISLWRVAPSDRVLTSEFSFQTKYEAGKATSARVRSLSNGLYLELQQRFGELTTSGSTKARELYELGRATELELSAA